MVETIVPKPPKKKNKILSILISFFSIILIIITITATTGFFLVYVPGKKLYDQVNSTKSEVNVLKTAISDKNLIAASNSLKNLQTSLVKISQSYYRFSWTTGLPYIKDYFKDGESALKIAKDTLETGEIVIKAVEPYQDFLGLKGASTDSSKTTSDRLAFLTESIEGLVPHLNIIEAKISSIEQSLNQINHNRYPEEFRGIKIKSILVKTKESIAEAHKLVKDGQPILTKMSWLLGKDKPRNYFLMFQNDAELRPTGNFLIVFQKSRDTFGKVGRDIHCLLYTSEAETVCSTGHPTSI